MVQKQEKTKAYVQEKKQLENKLLTEYQQQNGTTLTDREKSDLGTTLLEQRKDKIKNTVNKVIESIESYQNKNKNKQVDSDTINKVRKSAKKNSI